MNNLIYYYFTKALKKLRGASLYNSKIDKTSKVEAGSLVVSSVFKKHSFCGYDCEIINAEIGSFCSISSNVKIGGGMHPVSWVGMSPVFYKGRDSVKTKFSEFERSDALYTQIGNDVWIGQNVLIKQGVTIGHGAVVGMGSVVTKDVLPYSIVAGNPARLIRKRFSEDIIIALLEIKWWDFNDKDLKEYAQHFKNPQEFIIKYKNH